MKNIVQEQKELIAKHGEDGMRKILKRRIKKLFASLEDAEKSIAEAYEKAALASASATCGTVIITWLGDKVLKQCAVGSKNAIRLIAKNAESIINDRIDGN